MGRAERSKIKKKKKGGEEEKEKKRKKKREEEYEEERMEKEKTGQESVVEGCVYDRRGERDRDVRAGKCMAYVCLCFCLVLSVSCLSVWFCVSICLVLAVYWILFVGLYRSFCLSTLFVFLSLLYQIIFVFLSIWFY